MEVIFLCNTPEYMRTK